MGWLDEKSAPGKQYTSTLSVPISGRRKASNKLEEIYRPFVSYAERRDQALAKLRAAPGIEDEGVVLCFGQEQEFQFTEVPQIGVVNGTNTSSSDDDDNEQPPNEDTKIFVWNEEGRFTKTVKIVNPKDEEQFVYVKKTTEIIMRAPDGQIHRWKFKATQDANER